MCNTICTVCGCWALKQAVKQAVFFNRVYPVILLFFISSRSSLTVKLFKISRI